MKHRHRAMAGAVICAAAAMLAAPAAAQTSDALRSAVATLGDLDANGVVDTRDISIQLSNLGIGPGATPEQGDLDRDGDVDREDVRRLMAALGSDVDPNSEEVVRLLAEAGMIGRGGGHRSTGASDHQSPFSGSGHSAAYSQSHPNHDTTITAGWGDHGTSHSKLWDPNHFQSFSTTIPPTHNEVVSGVWPPNHVTASSEGWNDHLQQTSMRWPPNHDQKDSNNGDYGWHSGHISSTWFEHDHTTPASFARWPGNHVYAISQDWQSQPTPHVASVSLTWPPNHFASITSTWPKPVPAWPPNHFKNPSNGSVGDDEDEEEDGPIGVE